MTRSSLVRSRRKGLPFMAIISTLMIAAAGMLLVYELIAFTQLEDRLPGGLTIAGVRVGNLTENEAVTRLEAAYTSPVTLYYDGAPINLIPDEIGFEINTDVMLAEARAVGETGSGFWGRFLNYMLGQEEAVLRNIELVANYQRNALQIRLGEIASVYDRTGSTFTYDLDTLMIRSTGDGRQLNIESALPAIDAALRRPDQRAVDLPIIGGNTGRPELATLEELIRAYLDRAGFIYDGQNSVASVFILDLTTGVEINILSDVAYSAASTIKTGIMVDMYRTLSREPNRDEAFLMANSMLCSNNSSSNRLMELFLGNGNVFSGVASVTNTYQQIGATNTFLIAPIIDGSTGQVLGTIEAPETNPNSNYDTFADQFSQTTAEDMGTLMSLIYDCAEYGSGLMAIYPDGAFTQRECRQMVELMTANDLQRLLQAGVPAGTRIAHKNGWVPGALAGAIGAMSGDAGIVYSPNGNHYVISVFLWENGDTTGFERWPLIEEISRATWNYFNPETPLLTRRDDLPPTANECLTQDASGTILSYNYLPPYDQIDLDNINGWRDGTPTTPQPLPGEEDS